MKRLLRGRSRRYGYCGWALKMSGARAVQDWSVCTTREEARELLRELRAKDLDWVRPIDIVKVRVYVEEVNVNGRTA